MLICLAQPIFSQCQIEDSCLRAVRRYQYRAYYTLIRSRDPLIQCSIVMGNNVILCLEVRLSNLFGILISDVCPL